MSAKYSTGATVCGIIVTVFSAMANLLHLPWFIHILAEQVKTGWGGGTNIELAVLYPWMIEFLSIPILLGGIALFIASFFRRPKLGLLISSTALTLLLTVQFVLLNLFIIF